MIWLKLAVKEIINNKSFGLFFILNLAIGLVGYVILNSFSYSLNEHFQTNLKEMMTADLVSRVSRPFQPEELEVFDRVLGNNRQEAQVNNFLTMASGPGYSRLVEVYAVDGAFPLYGRLDLENSDAVSFPEKMKGLQQISRVWMSYDTAFSLRLKIGDTVNLGQKEFVLDDYIVKDHINAITSVEIAPRIYIGYQQLQETGLIDFGSRLSYLRFFRFPSGVDVKSLNKKLIEAFNQLHNDQSPIYVYGTERINRNLNRVIGYFSSYMGLIGTIALFLAGIGAGYLFRNYFRMNRKEIAILMSLGASRMQTYLVFLTQITILGVLASVLSIFFSGFLLPLIPMILQGIIPAALEVEITLKIAVQTIILGALGSGVFCLPTIINIHRLRPLVLLQDDRMRQARDRGFYACSGIGFLPGVLLFWSMSIIQTNSLYHGSVFLLGFIGVSAILSLTGIGFLGVCKTLANSNRTFIKIAFRNLYRNKISSFSCFLAISLGVFLINIIPQLQNGIQEEINRPDGLILPSFFLVDVQAEQLEPLKVFLKKRDLELTHASALIRGRIEKVNGIGFYDRNPESGKEQSDYRRREFNFSYRARLDNSEELIEGTPFSENTYDFESNEPAEISIAEIFAERRDLKIGDVIDFDIQGIPIKGKVVSIRRVRWTSFRPNFYILFQDGILNDAPHTFLASIPQINPSKKQQLQNDLVSRFPNISMLNIAELVKQILSIVDRVTFALSFMAYLSILTGIMVVFSIARHEALSRTHEINLLKILGAGFRDVRSVIQIEFGFLGFMAAFFAILLSLMASYIVSYLFFGQLWQFRWGVSLLSLVTITLISMITSLIGTESIIRQKAHTILQTE